MNVPEYDQWFTPIFGRIYKELGQLEARQVNRERHLTKGRCLIVNIERYENGEHSDREGSEADVKELRLVWQRFGCQVSIEENLSAENVLKTMSEFRDIVSEEGKEFGLSYFSVVCILAHGRRVDNVDEVKWSSRYLGVNKKQVNSERFKCFSFFRSDHRQRQRRDSNRSVDRSDHRCGIVSGNGWEDQNLSHSGKQNFVRKLLFELL